MLRTNGYIKMMAIYKHRLALLFHDSILIYSSNPHDFEDLEYQLIHTVHCKYDCNLLIVTNNHLIICTENKLEKLDFEGQKQSEWKFPVPIRYIKNISGAVNREGILVGLGNGEIYTVFIDKKYPILHYTHNGTIRCVDISPSKSKLSIVGEDRRIVIYDLQRNEILFQDTNANSVAFNEEFDDIFCFTHSGTATIRNFDGNFQFTVKTDGFIVRFSAATVYTLFASSNSMASFNIPQSEPLRRYIQSKSFENALQIAHLGVTHHEWKQLGLKAIEYGRFDVAKRAFTNLSSIREIVKYTDLVQFIELRYHQNQSGKQEEEQRRQLLLADIYAFQGRFAESAKLFCQHGQHQKAIAMYLDLRDWENAKELIERYNAENGSSSSSISSNLKKKPAFSMRDLLLKQAKWLQAEGDVVSAADMLWSAQRHKEALDLVFEVGKSETMKPKILSLMTQQQMKTQEERSGGDNVRDEGTLSAFYEYAAGKFGSAGDVGFVKEIYVSTKNYSKLIEILIEREEWDEAFQIIEQHKEHKAEILLPYAQWLATHDRFDEASKAFHEAGFPKYAMRILNNLTANCLVQKKYGDTAYYHWLLALEHLKFGHCSKFESLRDKSLIFYAYHLIDEYIQSPFTSNTPEVLFHAARFALTLYDENGIENQSISKVALMYILAKQCIALGAFKFARNIISKLITLRIPTQWRESIELDALRVRTKPFQDPPHLSSSICPRCSTSNSQHNQSPICSHCGHRFVHCMVSFQSLPLVEFKIVDSLSHDEAIKLLQREPPRKTAMKYRTQNDNDQTADDENQDVNVMKLDDADCFDGDDEGMGGDGDDHDDAFYRQLMSFDAASHGPSAVDVDVDLDSDQHAAATSDIVLDGDALELMDPSEIFIVDFRKYSDIDGAKKKKKEAAVPTYYRCIVPDDAFDIVVCPGCQLFFRGEEFEVVLINNGHLCPFCRFPFSASSSAVRRLSSASNVI